MADEKSSDPTPGSDPASPREPEQAGGADAVHPEEPGTSGAPEGDDAAGQLPAGLPARGIPADEDDSAADDSERTAARALPADEPPSGPEDDLAEPAADDVRGGRTAARAMSAEGPVADEPTDEELQDGDGPSEPELAGVSASRRPVRRDRAQDGSGAGTELAPRKGRATRRRDEGEADTAPGRTNPATFVNESVGELRKVVWPTAEQMRTYFVVVLVFVVFMIAVTSLLDLLFGWALLQVFR